MSGTGFAAAVPALRYRDFRLFWVAALVSNTGSWMQNAAVPYAIFRLTGANLDVGVTGFWLYFPMVLMGGLGGTLADRFQRKRLLVVTQAIQAAFSVALWAVVVSGHATVASISALSFGAGLAGGLNIPIWQSFVSQLVPRDTLANAVVLNSTQFNAARALGPLLFGGVVATFDVEVAFLLNAASFVAVLAVLPFIGAPQPARPDGSRPSPWADLVAGARYVWHTPGILACCVAIVAIAGIGNPLFSFLPASYGQEIFGVRGWALGLLSGAGGVGALIFAPLILTRGATMARSHLLVVAMVTYGAAVAVVGVAPVLWVALLGGLLFGGSYLAIASAINTTIQLLAREDMRGKSIAVYIMCLTGSLPIGLAIWGAVADVVGIRVTTVAAGLLLVAVTGVLHLTGRFAAMGQADIALAGP